MVLPEVSADIFVSDNEEDWNISFNGDRFKLELPITREGFSENDATAIDEVVLIFSPAGGVISQTSRIYSLDGVWMLEISGILSRKNTQRLVIHSIEVIYLDYSAELLQLKEAVPMKALNTQTEDSEGCNTHFGFAAFLPSLLLFLKRKSN